MTIEIKAPTLPESVPDGTIATWHKKAGDAVKRDELLVDIETDRQMKIRYGNLDENIRKKRE